MGWSSEAMKLYKIGWKMVGMITWAEGDWIMIVEVRFMGKAQGPSRKQSPHMSYVTVIIII